MNTIKIRVSKQMDGYTFWTLPSARQIIKNMSPNFSPANTIFISYDIGSNFEHYYSKLERIIYPALLGIDSQNDLIEKVDEIQFIDTQTEEVLHSHKVTA